MSDLAYMLRASFFATKAHAGVFRWSNGEPYINHPVRVAQQVITASLYPKPDMVAAAYLHDVIEDTDITAEDLRSEGFSERTIFLVKALSRNPGESYDDFIKALSACPDAVVIKLADICDNLATLPPGHKLARRYVKALATLHGVTL